MYVIMFIDYITIVFASPVWLLYGPYGHTSKNIITLANHIN